MKPQAYVPILCAGMVALALGARDAARATPAQDSVSSTVSTASGRALAPRERVTLLSPGFEPNRGQARREIRFLARGHGYSIGLTAQGAIFALAAPDSAGRRISARGGQPPAAAHVTRQAMVRMTFVGAARAPRIAALDPLSGTVNYALGADLRAWRTGIPTYAHVRYTGVFRGVDLIYYRGDHLEYDVVAQPGAAPGQIRLRFSGARALTLDAAGDLAVRTEAGALLLRRPAIYQEVGGERQPIAGGYRVLNARDVTFRLGAYDRRRALVIDPVVAYSTYLNGGAGDDYGFAVKVDGAGNAYVMGITSSDLGPSNTGLPRSAYFVSKVDPSGRRLLYTTVLLGACGTQALAGGMALDGAGNAYVAGQYVYQTAFGHRVCALRQALVVKLNSRGTPVYEASFGHPDVGTRTEANAVAVDGRGDAYMTGETDAVAGFPTTAGAFRTATSSPHTAFVLKVGPNGKLVYSTFLGGDDGSSAGTTIAVDRHGDAYVAGSTTSTHLPTTPNAYQAVVGSATDRALGSPFVIELNAAGSAPLYSTYLKGDGYDAVAAIALDAAGRAYVTGLTTSVHFPTTPDAYSRSLRLAPSNACGGRLCHPMSDAFVAEIDPNPALPARRTLVYATYLGGTANDTAGGIAVDAARHVYVAGATASRDFPTVAATQLLPGVGGRYQLGTADAFVAEIDHARSGRASLVFSTYLGGSGDDVGNDLAIDRAGNIYVVGTTKSADFPTRGPAQGQFGGVSDPFLARLDPGRRRP